MFSSAFGPQRAVTDARQEGEPKVWIWVVFALETLLISGNRIERMLVPFFRLIGDGQADACRCGAWTQRIGIEQRQGLAKFALGISFKLLASHCQRGEKMG